VREKKEIKVVRSQGIHYHVLDNEEHVEAIHMSLWKAVFGHQKLPHAPPEYNGLARSVKLTHFSSQKKIVEHLCYV
jgi:hypothetical protein